MSHCPECNRDEYVSFVGGVMLGAAIGAIAGILFAPHSGLETRHMLKQKGERAWKDVSKKVKPVVDKARVVVSEKVENLKGEMQEAMSEVKKKFKK